MALACHWTLDEAHAFVLGTPSVGPVRLSHLSGNNPQLLGPGAPDARHGYARRGSGTRIGTEDPAALDLFQQVFGGASAINFWTRNRNSGGWQGMWGISHAAGPSPLGLYLDPSNRPQLYLCLDGDTATVGTAQTSIVTPYLGTAWHMITAVREELGGGSWRAHLYVDKVLRATLGPYSRPLRSFAGASFEFGRVFSSGSNFLYSYDLDDMRVFDHALSLAEIEALYDEAELPPVSFGETPWTVTTPVPASLPFETMPRTVMYSYGGGVDVQPVGDVTAPTITNLVPVPGSRKIGRLEAISFDVVDEVGVARARLYASFTAGGLVDLVWGPFGFTPLYSGSTRVAIAGGFRYTVKRAGGWPSSPTFTIEAEDEAGNRA